MGVIASLAPLVIQIRQNTQQIRHDIEVGQVASCNRAQEQTWQAPLAMAQDSQAVRSLAKFSEQGPDALTADSASASSAGPLPSWDRQPLQALRQGLVDPENWENIVEKQLDVWWSNPHTIACIRSRPRPISKRFAICIERRIARLGHAA